MLIKTLLLSLIFLSPTWAESSDVSTPNVSNSVITQTQNVREKLVPPVAALAPVDLYTFLGQENYRYPARPRNKTMNLDVGGFYEVKVSGRDYTPKDPSDHRYQRIVRDPVYNKIPRDVLLGASKLDMKYNIQIDGQLDEDLTVHYDIEQEPDFPGKYDVKVNYKDKELTFFHYDADFNNGEFIAIKKALNGAQYYQKTPYSEIRVAMGRQRSEPKKFSTFGNGKKTYKLGNTSILKDSVSVWLNNSKITDSSYKINFYSGEIDFNDPPQNTDYIEIVYEFTNPIEDFLPVLSRKNFFGVQYKWQTKDTYTIVKKTKKQKDHLWPIIVTKNSSVSNNAVNDALIEIMEEASFGVSLSIVTADIKKRMPSTVFFLSQFPVVLGSEELTLNDQVLKSNYDYFLNQSSGRISIKTPILSSDSLFITYDTYIVTSSEKDIIGQGMPGPYPLGASYIIDGSLLVSLNGDDLKETRDFLVDYDQGKLYFNYEIKYPQIISVKYDSILAETITNSVSEKPFSLGASYLTEYASSQEDELTKSISSENVSVSNNIITLENNPIINTENMVITVGESRLSSSDYSIYNDYSGKIKLRDYNSGTVQVSYEYRRSYRTKHTFQGDGRTGAYINGEEAFTIRDIPMKYNGISFIRVWDGSEEILLENTGDSFTVDYGDTGQDIEITFLKQNSGNPYSKLTFYPDAGQTITIEYNYTSSQSLDPGDISQRMIGLSLGGNITNKWRIDTEIALADHNFSKTRLDLDAPIALKGTGVDNQVYNLQNSNIVEDTELIYINGLLMTKDTDYILNYIPGTIKFRNLTPDKSDDIQVDYKYFDSSGTTTAGEREDFKYATKMTTEYKSDGFNATAQFKHVDIDYLSISPIKETKGTTLFGGDLNWKIDKHNALKLAYTRRKTDKASLQNDKRRYLNQDNLSGTAKIRFFKYFDTLNSFHYNFQLEDISDETVSYNQHATDTLSYSWHSHLNFGPSFWKNAAGKSFSRSISDYIDRDAPTVINTSTHKYSSTLSTRSFPLLKEVTFKPSYSNSLSNTYYSTAPTFSYTTRQTFGFASDFKPFKSLIGSASYNLDKINSKSAVGVSENETSVLNENYSLKYTPNSWFNSKWSYSHTESESPLNSQAGKISYDESLSIPKFSVYGAVAAMGVRHNNPLLKPLKGSYFTLSASDKETFENNNKKSYHILNNTYTFNDFSPISGVKMRKYSINNRRTNLDNTVETATTSGNYSTSIFERRSGNLSFEPKTPILRLFSYSYSFEENIDSKKSETLAPHTTGNRTIVENPLFVRNQHLNLKPLSLAIPTPFGSFNLGNLTLSIQENWNDNKYTSITSEVPSDREVSVVSRTDDSTLSRIYTYTTSVSPFNLFTLKGTLVSSNSTIFRNTNSDGSTTFKDGRNYTFSSSYSPFKKINFIAKYNQNRNTQYISPSLNISHNESVIAFENRDYTDLTSYQNTLTTTHSLNSTFSPFSFLSLRAGMSVSNIKESHFTETTSKDNEIIEQESGNTGAVVRPIKNMGISYDYTIKKTRNLGSIETRVNEGYTGLTSLKYTPIKRKGFQIDIKYTRKDNWGFGLNSLDNSGSEQGSGQSLETTIIQQDNTEEFGSLLLNIDIPITRSPFIQSFRIEGEGYLKKVKDRRDAYKEGAENSLEIGGFSIKGTLLF